MLGRVWCALLGAAVDGRRPHAPRADGIALVAKNVAGAALSAVAAAGHRPGRTVPMWQTYPAHGAGLAGHHGDGPARQRGVHVLKVGWVAHERA